MSGECLLAGCLWVVSVATWTTPMPAHSRGLLVAYGSDQLMADQFWYRGYEEQGYLGGVAVMSPAHLGRVAWVRSGGGWVGPLLIVDTVARHHAYRAVFVVEEIAEVSDNVRRLLGFKNGAQGELFIGACPPPAWAEPRPYRPPLRFDHGGERHPSFWPYPEQQQPAPCPAIENRRMR